MHYNICLGKVCHSTILVNVYGCTTKIMIQFRNISITPKCELSLPTPTPSADTCNIYNM